MKVGIIGSGVGGLATAVRLACAGHNVEVFEKNQAYGGKLSYFEKDGYTFDRGPSIFTLPHLIKDIYDLCGRNFEKEFEFVQMDKSCSYFFNDGCQLDFYLDHEKLRNEIATKLEVSPEAYMNFLKSAQTKFEVTEPIFLRKSLHKANTYWSKESWEALKHIHKLDLIPSLNKIASKRLNHKKLVQIANRFATYNGSNPFQTSGIMALIAHIEQNLGVYFPKGGMRQISDSLYQLAIDKGVKFHFHTKIDHIETDRNMVKGIRAQENFFPFDIVVSNADIVPTTQYLSKNNTPDKKISNQERSSSAIIFYWGINKEFDNLGLHNILFSKNYKNEFDATFRRKEVSDDPTVYIHISSKVAKKDAPKGSENWFVMINTPPVDQQNWEKEIDKTRQNCIKKINDYLSTDIQQYIESETYWDPVQIEQMTNSYKGSIYGTSSNARLASFFRHANFHKKYGNLFFAGGSVHPGGGIPLCLYSAKITSELVKKYAEGKT